MITNGGDTEGLFRAAFMESGAPIPVGDISHGQMYYDNIAAETGCSGSSDTLACLRTVPYADLKAAMDHAPGFFGYQVGDLLACQLQILIYYNSRLTLLGYLGRMVFF